MKKLMTLVAIVCVGASALASGEFKAITAGGGSSTVCDTLAAAVTAAGDDGTVELQADATWDSSIALTDQRVTITSSAGNTFVLKRASSAAGFVVDANSTSNHKPDSDYTAYAEDKDGFYGNNGSSCYEIARLTFKDIIVDGGAVWEDAADPKNANVAAGSVVGGQLVTLNAGVGSSTSWNRQNLSGLKLENAILRNFKMAGSPAIESKGRSVAFRLNPGSKIVNCRGDKSVFLGYNTAYNFFRMLESEVTGCSVTGSQSAVLNVLSQTANWNGVRFREAVVTNNVAANGTYGTVYLVHNTPSLSLVDRVIIKDNFLADGTTPANVRLVSGNNVELYTKLSADSCVRVKVASQTPATDVNFGVATYSEDDANAAAIVYDGNPVSGVNWVGRVSGSSLVWKDATVPDPQDGDYVFRLKNPGAEPVLYNSLKKAFDDAQDDAVIELTADGTYRQTCSVKRRVTLTSESGHTYTLTRVDMCPFNVDYVSASQFGKLTITNLVVDGGAVWTNPAKIENSASTGIGAAEFVVLAEGVSGGGSTGDSIFSKSPTLTLGAGATVRNFKTPTSIGLIRTVNSYAKFVLSDGALITDCRGGGYLYRAGNQATRCQLNGGTVTRCSSSIGSTYGLLWLYGNSAYHEIGGVTVVSNYLSSSTGYAVSYHGSKSLKFTGGKTVIRDNFYVNKATTNQANFVYNGKLADTVDKTQLTGPMDKDADVRINYPTSGAVDGVNFMAATYTEADANPRAFKYEKNPVGDITYVGKVSGAYLAWVDASQQEVKHDQYDSFRVSNDGGETWTVKKSLKASFEMAEANAIIEVIDDHGELWQQIVVPVNGITLRSKPGERHVLTRTEAAGFTIDTTGRRMVVTNLVIDAGAVWATDDLGDPTEDAEQGGKAGNTASLFAVGLNDNQTSTHGYDFLDVEIRNFNGTGGAAVVDVNRGTVTLDAGTFIHDCRCGTNSLEKGSIVRTGEGGGFNTCVTFGRCDIYSNSCARVYLATSDRGLEYFGACSIMSNLVYDCAVRPAIVWDTTSYGCHFTGGKTFIWDNVNRQGARADFYPLSQDGRDKSATKVTMLDGEFAEGAKVGVCYPASAPDGVMFAFNNVTTAENPAAAFVYDANPVEEVNYVGFASGNNVIWKDETKTGGLEQEDAFRYRNVGDADWTVCDYLQEAFVAVTNGAEIEVIKADAKFDKTVTLTNGTVTLRSMPGLAATLARVEAAGITLDRSAEPCGLVVSNLTLSGGANWADPDDLYSFAQGAEAVGPANFFTLGSGSVNENCAALTLGAGVVLRDVYAYDAAIYCQSSTRVTLRDGALITGVRGGRVYYGDNNRNELRCDGVTVTRCASLKSGFGLRQEYSNVYIANLTVTNNLARGYPFVDAYGEGDNNPPTLHIGGGKIVIKDNVLHKTDGSAATTGNLRLGTATARMLFDGAVDPSSEVRITANTGATFGSVIGAIKTTTENVHPERFISDNLVGAYASVRDGKVLWSNVSTPAVASATDANGNVTYFATAAEAAAAVGDYGALSIIGSASETLALNGRHVTLKVSAEGSSMPITVGPFATVVFDGREAGALTGLITVNGRNAVFEANGATLGVVLVQTGSARLNDVAATTATATGGELYVAYSDVGTLAASGAAKVTLGFGNTIASQDVAASVALDEYAWTEDTTTDAVRMSVDGGEATAYATFDAAVAAIPATAETVVIELLRNATYAQDFSSNKFKQSFALTVKSAPEAGKRFVLRRAANVRLRAQPADASKYAHAFRFENVVQDGGAVWQNAFYTDLSAAEMTANDGLAASFGVLRVDGGSTATLASGAVVRNAGTSSEAPLYATGRLYMEAGASVTDCRVGSGKVFCGDNNSARLTMTGGRIDHNVSTSSSIIYNTGSSSNTNLVFTGGEIVRNFSGDATIYVMQQPYVFAGTKLVDNVSNGNGVLYERNAAGSCGYFWGDAVVRANRKTDGTKNGLYLQARPAVVDGVLGQGAYLEVFGQNESVTEGGVLSGGGGVTYTEGSAGFDRIVYKGNPKSGVYYAAKSDGAGKVVWSAASLVVGAGETKSVTGDLSAKLVKYELDGALTAGACEVSGAVTFPEGAILSVGADAAAVRAMRGGMQSQAILTAASITPPAGGIESICRLPRRMSVKIVTNGNGTQSLVLQGGTGLMLRVR